jgi:hypothetical protein
LACGELGIFEIFCKQIAVHELDVVFDGPMGGGTSKRRNPLGPISIVMKMLIHRWCKS